LSKAYAEATKKTLKEIEYVFKTSGYEIEVEIEYKDLKNFEYFVKENTGNIIEETFLNNVKIKMEIPIENLEKITNNNNNTSFKIVKYDILNSKMIDIYSKTKIN
jgi:putative IMPACT (imprinted ancient) family translation regulator